MKKLLAMVLATVMAVTCLTVFVSAEETYEPVNIIYSANRNENADKATLDYMAAITEASGGAVTFDINLNSSLIANANDVPESLTVGIADMSLLTINNFPGLFPLLYGLVTMPMLTYSPEAKMQIYDDMFAAHPELDAEIEAAGLKRLGWTIAGSEGMIIKLGKEYQTIDDLKGKKIWAASDIVSNMLVDIGAIPTTVAFTDAYTSLEKSVIDGAINAPAAVAAMGWHNVCDNWVPIGTATGVSFFVMSLDKWNSLPENVQQLFVEFEPERRQGEMNVQGGLLGLIMKDYSENGKWAAEQLTDEQKAEWDAVAAPYIASVVEDMASEYPEFPALYEDLLARNAEY